MKDNLAPRRSQINVNARRRANSVAAGAGPPEFAPFRATAPCASAGARPDAGRGRSAGAGLAPLAPRRIVRRTGVSRLLPARGCGKVAAIFREDPSMKEAEAVTFAGATLDRAAQLRGDPAALAALEAGADARCLAIWRGRPLVDGGDGMALAWLPTGHPVFAGETGGAIFLGRLGGAPRFARDLAGWPGPAPLDEAAPGFHDDSRTPHPDLPGHLAFADLRAVMSQLGVEDAGVAAAAKGIFAWHAGHGFCARCGAASEVADAGWKRVCPVCGGQHFPRTDPVVIMLVTLGDQVLLGRSAAWPTGMYSLLAGFMEPGESIEAAVRREIWEEAGVQVGAVEYLSSQPWPFPSSLMIGCRGLALSREIALDPVELEDARWLTRQEVLDGLTGRDPDIRPARKGSIARFLLERWLADRLA